MLFVARDKIVLQYSSSTLGLPVVPRMQQHATPSIRPALLEFRFRTIGTGSHHLGLGGEQPRRRLEQGAAV